MNDPKKKFSLSYFMESMCNSFLLLSFFGDTITITCNFLLSAKFCISCKLVKPYNLYSIYAVKKNKL